MPFTAIGAFAFVCVLPAAAFWLLSRGFDWLVRYEPHGGRIVPATAELDQLGANLRRLNGEHAWLLRADVPGKATRLRAVQLAYDDTLLRAAALLNLDVASPPLRAASRLQTEAELAAHGFTW